MRLTLLRSQRVSCFVCAMLCFTFLYHSDIEAQEPRFFRFTGVEGELSLRHSRDEVEQGETGVSSSTSRLTTNEEEISILTHSYVYHPNLLKIDLGVGLLYTQKELEQGSVKQESEGELYSLTAQLRFLEKKPYPFTLFYHRVNPSTKVSGTERFVSENVKYGVNASLLEPVLPFSVNMEAFRETSQGSGVTQVVNQTNDQVFLRAYHSLDNDGHVQFTYHNRQQLSESGVRGRPIDRTDRKSESTSLASDVKFGEEKQFKLINLFSYFTQDNLPQQRDFRWTPSLTWRHSANVESFYRFDYTDSEINAIKSTGRSGGIGARANLTDKLAINGEVRATNNETVGLQTQSKGASTAVSFTQPLTIGQLQLGAGTSYDLTENEAPENLVSQQNERLRYDGVERLQLARPYVVSISNIAVERDGVIIYPSIEGAGIDYTSVEEGALTFINVVIKPDAKVNLGDTLIVDYTYDTGGTVSFSTVSYHYSARLSMFKYYTLYASYTDTEQELKEGESSIPLNSVQYTRAGARVDHPFLQDKFRVGVEGIYEKQEEEISPYIRRTIDTFFQAALTNNTSVRLNVRRVRQDNLPSTRTGTNTGTQDVDILSRGVTLTTRPWPRSILRLAHSDEEDTGGTVPHRIKRNLIQIQWRVRKLTLSVDGSSVDERQGEFTRQTNSISANLVRTF